MGLFNTSLFVAALNMRARHRTRVHPGTTYFPLRNIGVYQSVKRVAGTILSIGLLILLAPVFFLTILAIRLDSPGPAFFRQTRIGKGGKPFSLYKFRTMDHHIDRRAHEAFLAAYVNGKISYNRQDRSVYKPAKYDQITRMGRFLRRTSLDELPQLINIARGEMSFIGPRPNLPAEVEAYKDWHRIRLQVLPGVTGLAQINGRSSIPFDQIVRYDIEYVENEGLLMDLNILWQTLPVVLLGRGAK
jgi:lipopolysaccharide/colanic/teichoic acid biosynthesis glycosyltransferase